MSNLNRDERAFRVIERFVKSSRNYRIGGNDCVRKVWNRGMGLLDLFRVYPDRNRCVVVNDALFCKSDEPKMERLRELLSEEFGNCADDWKVVHCWLGYPLYYNRSLSLGLAREQAKQVKSVRKGQVK